MAPLIGGQFSSTGSVIIVLIDEHITKDVVMLGQRLKATCRSQDDRMCGSVFQHSAINVNLRV
jgi:hypothetical protein